MGIRFGSGTEINAAGSRINIPGSVIQFVDNTATISATVDTSGWLNLMTTSITTSKANQKIMVQYLMNERSDQGLGAWCLIYHRILANGVQIANSGHHGNAGQHIGFYERTLIYDAPTAGTYTFQGQTISYGGTAWIGQYNTGSTNHYLRLYEIGT
jgi:hypothetical protein